MTENVTTAGIVDELNQFRGRVVLPDQPDYDDRRKGFYGGVDRRPAAILRAEDADDVALAISIARDRGLELAIRSGGHSVASHSTTEGGILLDLGDMQAIDVDRKNRTAWAQPGLTAGAYSLATAEHGLATGFGDTGTVGIGGITLGGGVGYLSRKLGLTIDSLLAADIVTADGQLRRADAATHPELFWAIRGGGGNFGVVTRFQFRLHEIGSVYGGLLAFAATAEALAALVSAAESAPEDLSAILNVIAPAPPMPFLPPEYYGLPVLLASIVYAGPPEKAEQVLAPFRAVATPLADMLRPMSYPEIFPPEDPTYHPVAVSRNLFLDEFDRRAAETIVHGLESSTAPMRACQIRVLGGAVARVPMDATAYAFRDRPIMVNVAALYGPDGDPTPHREWVESLTDKLRGADRSAYVNFMGDEGPTRVWDAYPRSTWERLAAVKARYDPGNLFRLNHNIQPARREARP